MVETRAEQEGSAPENVSFVGLSRLRFDYGSVPAGVTASMKKIMRGRLASQRKGGATLYAASGMSQVAT